MSVEAVADITQQEVDNKKQLLAAMRMAIRQIQSGEFSLTNMPDIKTMPIPAGANKAGFTRYVTGIRSIEFSLIVNSPSGPWGDSSLPEPLDDIQKES